MFSSRVMRSIAERELLSWRGRCSDVSHSVDRDFLVDLALLEECVRLSRDDAAIRDDDQCICRRLVPRCCQLPHRAVEDRRNGIGSIGLIGKAEDAQGLTVIEEPSQDAKGTVRDPAMRVRRRRPEPPAERPADGAHRRAAESPPADGRRLWRAAVESFRLPDSGSVSRPGSSTMIRSSRVSEPTRLVVSARAESSAVRVSRAMTSTSRASSASSAPEALARAAWSA